MTKLLNLLATKTFSSQGLQLNNDNYIMSAQIHDMSPYSLSALTRSLASARRAASKAALRACL